MWVPSGDSQTAIKKWERDEEGKNVGLVVDHRARIPEDMGERFGREREEDGDGRLAANRITRQT